MSSKPITLAIVDDYLFSRKILENYLTVQYNINVAFQTADLAETFNKLASYSIDVLIMDIQMHQSNVLESINTIRSKYPNLKILILTLCTDLDLISRLLDLGIHGYVSKENDPEELLKAIKDVSANKVFRNWFFTEVLYRSKQNSIVSNSEEIMISLDSREKKIIELLWEEKSNKEIAEELFLGVRSVEKIRQDLKEKLKVRSTIGILKYGIANKIIDAFRENIRVK